jgi:hypothetical protein
VRSAFDDILSAGRTAVPGATIDGVLVQEMVRGGKETIAGVTRDPSFGPLVMFGLGGIFVEVLRDVIFRVVPIERHDAADMLGQQHAATAIYRRVSTALCHCPCAGSCRRPGPGPTQVQALSRK